MVVSVMAMPGADLRREKAVRLFSFVSEYLALVDRADRSSQTQVVLHLDRGASVGFCLDPATPLRVCRPSAIEFPPLPAALRNWIAADDLINPDLQAPPVQESATFASTIASDGGAFAHEVRFLEDYPEVRDEWDRYVLGPWSLWAADSLRMRGAKADYARLALAYLRFEQFPDCFELVFSPLRVEFVRSGEQVCLHVASQTLQVEMCEADESLSVSVLHDGGVCLEDELRELLLVDASVGSLLLDQLALYGDGLTEDEFLTVANLGSKLGIRLFPEACIVVRPRLRRELSSLIEKAVRALHDPLRPIPEPILDCLLGVSDRRGTGVLADPVCALPARTEDMAIARALSKERCVVVNAPAGPRRTRTIAAVVCSLMAEGKRVLVTSSARRTIREVIGALPPAIRELWRCEGDGCWALRPAGSDLRNATAEKQIDLESARVRLTEVERVLARSASVHISEYELPGGYSGTPIEVARALAGARDELGWLPFKVQADEVCPVEAPVAAELLSLLRAIDQYRELELVGDLPSIEQLPSPSAFDSLVRRERNDRAALEELSALSDSPVVELLYTEEDGFLNFISGLSARTAALHSELVQDPNPWVREAADDVLTGRRAKWAELWSATRRYLREIDAYPRTILDLEVTGLGDRSLGEVEEHARGLMDHLRQGGSLGFLLFRSKRVRDAGYITTDITVNGESCATAQHLWTLCRWLEVKSRLRKLGEYWNLYMMADVMPPREQVSGYTSRLPLLQSCMELDEMRRKLHDVQVRYDGNAACVRHDFTWPWAGAEALRCWIASVEHVRRARRLSESALAIDRVVVQVSSSDMFRRAVESRDQQAYARAYLWLQEASACRDLLARRNSILSLCGPPDRGASLLAQFRSDPDISEWDRRYDRFTEAWGWQRAMAGLSGLIGEEHLGGLATAARSLRQEVRAAASMLAEAKADFGLMAPMGRLDSALPHIGPDIFDVAIIDEADRLGPEGLIAQYLTPCQMLLGDGTRSDLPPIHIDDMPRLRREYLAGIPLASIMRKRVSYMEMVTALWSGRSASSVTAGRHEVTIRPASAVPESAARRANAVAERAADLVRTKVTGGVTIGVVTMCGSAQARMVEERLVELVGPRAMKRADLICTDARGFAGLSRDIVLLELPDPWEGGNSIAGFRAELTSVLRGVAETFVIAHVGSLADMDPSDPRREAIESCMGPHLAELRPRDRAALAETSATASIARELRARGYIVHTEVPLEGCSLNLLVDGDRGRLGIVVHEPGHITWDEESLRALGHAEDEGLRVCHIVAVNYVQHPDEELRQMWHLIDEVGIVPREKLVAEGEGAVATEDVVGTARSDSAFFSMSRSPKSALAPVADVMALFADRGHQVIDKRAQGGCLWVLGGRNLSAAMDELQKAGLYFQYAPGGSRATAFRSAWYTR